MKMNYFTKINEKITNSNFSQGENQAASLNLTGADAQSRTGDLLITNILLTHSMFF